MEGFIRKALAWCSLSFVLAVSGCATVQTTQGGVVGVDRKQNMSLVSREQVDASAKQQYVAVLKESGQKGQLNVDPGQTARVRKIAQRLIPQTVVFREDARNWPWEINVIKSDEVNAWCMPSGKIVVYTGLIDKLKLTDDELAAVMGHEISHALREHARERMSQSARTSLGASAIGVAAAVLTGSQAAGDLAEAATGVGGQYMFLLPNSRDNEQEADRIGVELAARAGYDPRAAVTLWQKMGTLTGGKAPPQWMSTHPSGETRIKDVQDYAQKVLPLYEATRH